MTQWSTRPEAQQHFHREDHRSDGLDCKSFSILFSSSGFFPSVFLSQKASHAKSPTATTSWSSQTSSATRQCNASRTTRASGHSTFGRVWFDFDSVWFPRWLFLCVFSRNFLLVSTLGEFCKKNSILFAEGLSRQDCTCKTFTASSAGISLGSESLLMTCWNKNRMPTSIDHGIHPQVTW